jgi:hypothetical protein
MKTTSLFVAAALAACVSAAQNAQQSNNVGANRGGFANNQKNKFGNQGQNRGGQNSNNNKGQAASSVQVTATAAASSVASAATATGSASNGDAQTSLTLDPKVIATGFADNGQDVPTAGQVASLTSTNNFINFCLTVPNLPITNGKQITTGSCNPAPMGVIPSTENMPSAKFVSPTNGDSLVEHVPFTVTMAVANFQTGAFVNAAANYFAAPQQVNANGQIIGHSHITIDQLASLDDTSPTDPKKFAYFKGLNAAAQNGVLTASVDKGLPAGFYRLASINTAANHQPVLVPVAQHGSLDDAVYFTVTAAGANSTASATGVGAAAASSAAASTAASTAATGVAAANAGTVAAGNGAATGASQGNNKNNNQNKNVNQQKNGRNRRHARAFAQL